MSIVKNARTKLVELLIPQKGDAKSILVKKWCCLGVAVLLLSSLLFGGSVLVNENFIKPNAKSKATAKIESSEPSSEEEESSEISSEVSSEESSEPEVSSVASSKPAVTSKQATTTSKPAVTKAQYPSEYLPEFESLWKANPEIKARLIVPNTKVNYPVPQGSNNSYYLNRNEYKKSYAWGVPYLDYRVNLTASKNFMIYGHSDDKSGLQLAGVKNYKDLAFYQSTPVIEFNTVYEKAKWKVIGFFLEDVSNKNPDGPFQYHNYINDTGEAGFNSYIENVKKRSFINTTVDVQPSDTLLSISTCYSLSSKDFRYVLVARKVRAGESESVDTAGATVNTARVVAKRPIQ